MSGTSVVDEMFPFHEFLPGGQVYSIKRKRFIKVGRDKDGYALIGVTKKGGGRLCVRVHRQVATKFIPNPDNKPFVNHKDGNKFNNNISNLEWVTAKENSAHAIDTGLVDHKGENSPTSKLKDSDVYRIRELYSSGLLKQSEIARAFNISQRLVSLITRKESWRHLS